MPNTPLPGRIATPQKLRGISSSEATGAPRKTQTATETPKNSFFRNTRTARSLRATLPGPAKKRITGFGQGVFIAFALLVDGTEAILDLFIIGAIVNRIIDIVVGGIFFLYALAKGLTIAGDSKIYGSIFGTIAGEFIPGLDIAPFFTLDAWYITRSLKAKDRAEQQAVDEETKAIVEEQGRQDWIENYQTQQALQAQEENEQVERIAA